jgi:hypothetical protein
MVICPRLHLAIRLTVRHGVAPVGRYALSFPVPITIENDNEGYAYRIKGPGGRRCDHQLAQTTAASPYTSYLAIAGTTLHLVLLPLNGEVGDWCPGTYQIQAVFSTVYLTPSRRGQTPTIHHHVKIIGTTTLDIPGVR